MTTTDVGIKMVKTKEALKSTVFALLETQSLESITVRTICEATQINRAVFYAYFSDKYDLIDYCLENQRPS